MQQAELIIAYLKGELEGSQLREFEQRLLSDPELKSTVKDYQTILEGFKGMRQQATLEEISSWGQEEDLDEEEVLILAYVEGKMEPVSRKAFEQAMDQNAELKQKVDTQLAILQGFKGIQHDAFAQEVAQWAEVLPDSDKFSTAKVVPLPRRSGIWRYGAAAAVLVLIVAAFWLFSPGGSDDFSYTAFQEENYVAPGDPADRGTSEDAIIEASRDIKRGDYAAAVEKLQNVTETDSLFTAAQFWLGHSYYQLERYDSAVEAFNQSLDAAAQQLPAYYRDNAAWTRILAYLALFNEGPTPEAKQQLQTVLGNFLETGDQSDTYYGRGLELQKGLNSVENY